MNTVTNSNNDSNVSSDGYTQRSLGNVEVVCYSHSRSVTFCLAIDRGLSHHLKAFYLKLQHVLQLQRL